MVRLMLVLGLVLSLAACGGSRTDGLSKAEEQALQDRVDAAEAAKKKAEEEKAKADDEKAAALERERIAEDEQERQRQAALDAQRRADEAKREQDRLKADAEEAERKRLLAESSVALAGLVDGTPPGTASVTPKYRAAASVSAPGVTFSNPRGSSAGKWFVTTLSNRGATNQDDMVVYSDVGGAVSTAIMEEYPGFTAIEDTNLLMIVISTDAHKSLVKSSKFPRSPSTIPIPLTEVSAPDNDPLTDDPKDMARFSGSFDGASGEFRCIGSGDGACTVQYTGVNYLLAGSGTWTFRTSKNSKVNVADEQYMHFGWWRRQTIADGMFRYGTFRGTNGSALNGTGFNGLEGTAVYKGSAIGQYAIYAPLSPLSNHGNFNATATLTANFGNDTESGNISGSITGFDVNSGWTVTLNDTTMPSGAIAEGGVSWMIDGNTEDGGNWDALFHADVETHIDTRPDGVTGTFTAQYSTVGRMIGAFGAHLQ